MSMTLDSVNNAGVFVMGVERALRFLDKTKGEFKPIVKVEKRDLEGEVKEALKEKTVRTA
jgi:hypothetical protein